MLEGIKEKKPTEKDQFPAPGEVLVWQYRLIIHFGFHSKSGS
ncbi:MAG: hypothetical protein ACI8VT_002800, partial [Saprospiraceae bacterium]